MNFVWTSIAWSDFCGYVDDRDRQAMKKIRQLLKEAERDRIAFLEASEPLKHDLNGFYSRRVTKEHRLVFRFSDEGDMEIIQCRFHY